MLTSPDAASPVAHDDARRFFPLASGRVQGAEDLQHVEPGSYRPLPAGKCAGQGNCVTPQGHSDLDHEPMADQYLKVIPEMEAGPPSARLGVMHAVMEWPDQGFQLLQRHAAAQGSESAAAAKSDNDVKRFAHTESEAARSTISHIIKGDGLEHAGGRHPDGRRPPARKNLESAQGISELA